MSKKFTIAPLDRVLFSGFFPEVRLFVVILRSLCHSLIERDVFSAIAAEKRPKQGCKVSATGEKGRILLPAFGPIRCRPTREQSGLLFHCARSRHFDILFFILFPAEIART